MEKDTILQTLFQYACNYQFKEFDELLNKAEALYSVEDRAEAYLLRAQIKLFTADSTLMEDLTKVQRHATAARFPGLDTIWGIDAPNRFIIYSEALGELQSFAQSLESASEILSHFLGDHAKATVRQVQSEVCYFTGETERALALAEEQNSVVTKSATETMLMYIVFFRCHLALGQIEEAEEYLLKIIELSQVNPECVASYKAFRGWMTLTTSWSGDTPRFTIDAEGRRLPSLQDRIEGVRSGTDQDTPLEAPFIKYAKRSYKHAYLLRQHYMDILHAMYWHQMGNTEQTERHFKKMCQTASRSGVIMPLIECGEQVTPLLEYARNNNWEHSSEWLDMIIERAQHYEQSLKKYQAT